MKKMTKERIVEIINDSKDIYEALVALYEEAMYPVKWNDVSNVKPWGVQINKVTGMFILEEMHKKFTKDDSWPVNALMLNKGFSTDHPEIPDWKVKITKDCYQLITV